MNGQDTRGIVGLLFDFSFTDFITTRLIKLIYVVGTGLIGFSTLVFLVSGFSQGATIGFVALLLSPVVFLLGVAFLRVQLEVVMVMFRIADNTKAMAEGRASE